VALIAQIQLRRRQNVMPDTSQVRLFMGITSTYQEKISNQLICIDIFADLVLFYFNIPGFIEPM
jgi:hypothetical protein